jgi:hypothetical protein
VLVEQTAARKRDEGLDDARGGRGRFRLQSWTRTPATRFGAGRPETTTSAAFSRQRRKAGRLLVPAGHEGENDLKQRAETHAT